MRETEMASIGSSATTPQPTSANAPNGSRCVTRAGITSPGVRRLRKARLHSSCAARRESRAVVAPFSSLKKPCTRKHTGLFTRERIAISRAVPSRIPTAPSSRGISPFMHPRSIIRLCPLYAAARLCFQNASFSPCGLQGGRAFCMAARFSGVCRVSNPPGSNGSLYSPPFFLPFIYMRASAAP